VDVGGVIIDRINDNTDTSFLSDNYLKTTSVPGTFEHLTKLNNSLFKDRVFIVSKCGEKVQNKTLEWMAYHNFYEVTGIPKERVNFCRKRDGKGPICRDLGITHFVDDRLEVLSYMLDDVEKLYLFKPQEHEVKGWEKFLPKVTRVETWPEFKKLLEDEIANMPNMPVD